VLRGRRALDVCAELHDDAFRDERLLLAAVDEMVSWGWHLVVADPSPGAAADVTRLLTRIRPAYVQVDLTRPGRADDPALAGWLDTATEVGAAVLALGVDTSRDLETALAIGATYGRGSLLGRAVSRPA
jgi:EAL domain-containing protein (putative c-di-GMP-specific phosphodiesterase class I)